MIASTPLSLRWRKRENNAVRALYLGLPILHELMRRIWPRTRVAARLTNNDAVFHAMALWHGPTTKWVGKLLCPSRRPVFRGFVRD
jgi:predicted phage tail protein